MSKNVGEIVGIYTIIDVCNDRHEDGHLLYRCRCNVCGKVLIRKLFEAKSTTQCRHLDVSWLNPRIGMIWRTMVARCYNPKRQDYRWYGGRGIEICFEWLNNPSSFEEWAIENGYNDNLTIDRINVDKNYMPENCRWISIEENVRRAGNVNWITVGDLTLTGRQWGQKLGIGINTINKTIKKHGVEKTKELIEAMVNEPPSTKTKNLNQSWFSVYEIQLGDKK